LCTDKQKVCKAQNGRGRFQEKRRAAKILAAAKSEPFGNYVDQKLVGFPPIPQKKAEWMGHGSLQ
jgi:hypothetical protein